MMSTDDDASESELEEKKSYGLVWRVILFLFIAGPASVFAFGIYARTGLRSSIIAGLEKGDYTPAIVVVLWVIGMISTAFMIFKK